MKVQYCVVMNSDNLVTKTIIPKCLGSLFDSSIFVPSRFSSSLFLFLDFAFCELFNGER
jgi:hypothetical protein